MEYYDENFGHWEDMDDPDTQQFYRDTQRKSVYKKCSICGHRVKLLPQYDKCDRCCCILEAGGDPY